MKDFLQNFEAFLSSFTPHMDRQAVIFGEFFTQKEGKVAEFVAEIRATALQLNQQEDAEHTEVLADKLLKQFDALQKAINRLPKKQEKAVFHSAYRFPRNVHSMPPEKRLNEYRKALRALNDKVSWLLEQQYKTDNEAEKITYQQQIQETEYRKMKCLAAIEELEEVTAFK